jgi:thiol:disulfide interchange protein
MKTIGALLALTMLVLVGYTFRNYDAATNLENGIKFHQGTWDEALALAKKEKKLVFLDVYATWCGHCKKIKRTTFVNEEVVSYYNQTFVNVSLDGEQEVGASLRKKYELRGYPALLFIDSDGNIVHQEKGYKNPEDFLAIGKKAISK